MRCSGYSRISTGSVGLFMKVTVRSQTGATVQEGVASPVPVGDEAVLDPVGDGSGAGSPPPVQPARTSVATATAAA